MRFKRNRVIIFFVLLAVALSTTVALLGLRLLVPTSQAATTSQATTNPTSQLITHENALPGTGDWEIPDAKAASTQIQAYANTTSVSPGQKLTFYVSTQKEGATYSIDIYRLGWYGGSGGRLMLTVNNLTGTAQGYYDTSNNALVGCNSCHIDVQTGFIEANWHPSYTFKVPPEWVTGVYLAKFTDIATGMQTYAPFDVRGNLHSAYVVVTSDTTYEAYNYWGGYSLYDAKDDLGPQSLGRGVKVSFDRPYVGDYGAGQVLVFELDSIHWLERQGYDLSYISSIDLDQDPGQLLQHRAYISLGHDEYWTKEMRDGVELARDQGVSLAFLAANAAYWQIRFQSDSAGNSRRTIVCYKVLTWHHDLAQDPLYGKDNSRVTSQWRDPVINRPENALIGIMYSSLTSQQPGFPWRESPQAKSILLNGTNLQPGMQYGCGLVGYEWDRVFNNGATPKGLQVLAESDTIDVNNHPDTSNTTYYVAPSGALVFATGSIFWDHALDSYRARVYSRCTGQDSVVPGIQTLMEHVMLMLLNHQMLH